MISTTLLKILFADRGSISKEDPKYYYIETKRKWSNSSTSEMYRALKYYDLYEMYGSYGRETIIEKMAERAQYHKKIYNVNI